jgi:hypothetical protein
MSAFGTEDVEAGDGSGTPQPRDGASRRGMPCRRFGLLDGMILIAGMAVGMFLGVRADQDGFSHMSWSSWLVMFSGCILMLSSVLMLILRLRQPRPPMRRVANQPGFVACFTMVTVGMVLLAGETIEETCFHWFKGGWARWDWSGDLVFLLGGNSVFSWPVVISWSLLLIGRRWRPERGWIDGIGRLIGYAWIAWGLLGFIMGLLDEYAFFFIPNHKG